MDDSLSYSQRDPHSFLGHVRYSVISQIDHWILRIMVLSVVTSAAGGLYFALREHTTLGWVMAGIGLGAILAGIAAYKHNGNWAPSPLQRHLHHRKVAAIGLGNISAHALRYSDELWVVSARLTLLEDPAKDTARRLLEDGYHGSIAELLEMSRLAAA